MQQIEGGDPLRTFTEFRHFLELLEIRNQRLKLGRTSVAADMLKERSGSSGMSFEDLMQVDFIFFLRAELAGFGDWWPETLVYLSHWHRTFEIFERSRSNRYFERIQPILGNASKDDLENLMQRYAKDPQSLPRWQGSRLSPAHLIGIQNLCSNP